MMFKPWEEEEDQTALGRGVSVQSVSHPPGQNDEVKQKIAHALELQTKAMVEMDGVLGSIQTNLAEFTAAVKVQKWWKKIRTCVARKTKSTIQATRVAKPKAGPSSKSNTEADLSQGHPGLDKEDLRAGARATLTDQQLTCPPTEIQRQSPCTLTPPRLILAENLAATRIQLWYKHSALERTPVNKLCDIAPIDVSDRSLDSPPLLGQDEFHSVMAMTTETARRDDRAAAVGRKRRWWRSCVEAEIRDKAQAAAKAAMAQAETWQALLASLDYHGRAIAQMDHQLLTVQKRMDEYAAARLIQRWWTKTTGTRNCRGSVEIDSKGTCPHGASGGGSTMVLDYQGRAIAQMDRQPLTVQKRVDEYAAATMIQSWWTKTTGKRNCKSSVGIDSNGTCPHGASGGGSTLVLDYQGRARAQMDRLLLTVQKRVDEYAAATMIHRWWTKTTGKRDCKGSAEIDSKGTCPHGASGGGSTLVLDYQGRARAQMDRPLLTVQKRVDEYAAASMIQCWWTKTMGTRNCKSSVEIDFKGTCPHVASGGGSSLMLDYHGRAIAQMDRQLLTVQKRVDEYAAATMIHRWWTKTAGKRNRIGSVEIDSKGTCLHVASGGGSTLVLVTETPELQSPSPQLQRLSIPSMDPPPLSNAVLREEGNTSFLEENSRSRCPVESSAAALLVQRWWRSILARRGSEAYQSTVMIPSVVKLQSCWRMYVARKNYERVQSVTQLLPSRTRMYMVSKIQGPSLWGSQVQSYLKKYGLRHF